MDAQQPAFCISRPVCRGCGRHGFTVENMAAQLGVTPADVLRYESGAEIPVSYLFNVAQVFQVDLTVLISARKPTCTPRPWSAPARA